MKKISLLLISAIFCIAIEGQELSPQVLSPGGEFFSVGNHSVSWTLGELAIETFEQSEVILQQGFQFHETSETNSIDNSISTNYSFYPNPVLDKLKIKFGNSSTFSGELHIYDLVGNLMVKQQIYQAVEATVNLENFPPSAYLIQLFDAKYNSIKNEVIIKQ